MTDPHVLPYLGGHTLRMIDFHDPAVVLLNSFALEKLNHAVNGLYIWEFFTSLYYEWRVIRGHQPYRWTIWIYSLTRIATLITVILNMIAMDVVSQPNCQALATFGFIFAYFSFACSSLLIVLRIIAIWNRNKVVLALVIIVWGIDVSLLVHGIIKIRSAWDPAQDSCGMPNVKSNIATIISMFITDIFLLSVMLVGLFRMGRRGTGVFSLGRLGHLLWKQGVIWLSIAVVAEIPPLVFVCLDLNDAFNMIFMMPSLITMSIAATRMYRCLADSASATEVVLDYKTPHRMGLAFLNSNSTLASSISPKRMEVVVHTAHDQYPTIPTDKDVHNDHPERLCDTPHSLGLDGDVESRV